MTSNQSGAEKDNRLLFREQWVLLFSKSQMGEVFCNQSDAELRIQDGGIGSDTLSSRETWSFVECYFLSIKCYH